MRATLSPSPPSVRRSLLVLLAGVLVVLSLVFPAAAADVPSVSLAVSSNPSSARVYLQGVLMGTTPYTTRLSPGEFSLRVILPGYEDYAASLKLTTSQVATIDAVLNKVAATGMLSVTSTTAGARIFIDDALEGSSPATREVAPGAHTVRITAPGYTEFMSEATVVAGKTVTFEAVLIPASTTTTGWLDITSSPAGAAVLVDGVAFGPTPITVNPRAGTHTLRLVLAGYQDSITPVTITAGETLPVSPVMIPLPAMTPPATATPKTPVSPVTSAAGTGTLILTSLPAGAKVYLDGTYVGFTPAEIRTVTAGTHQVLFTYPEYADATYTVTVRAGQENRVDATLELAGVHGIVTQPPIPGFSVFLALAALGALALFRLRR